MTRPRAVVPSRASPGHQDHPSCLLLVEAANSAYRGLIEHAAKEAGLSVQPADRIDAPPHDAIVGVGPSVGDPLQVARRMRESGTHVLLVFFAASRSERDQLHAELIRNPFIYPRYEIVELPNTARELAGRMGRVVARTRRRAHSSGGERRTRDTSRTAKTRAREARDDVEIRRLQEALLAANRQNDEFLAIMSHELRTPLTSILGYTDMLLRGLGGPLAPLTNKYVTNVRSAGDRLLELVNGLLDYTRLESGADRLEKHPMDLARTVGQVVQLHQAAAHVRLIDMRFAIAAGVATRIQGDEEKLCRVLHGMLANALKFTPDGGKIAVHVGFDPTHSDAVRVSITDSGIGMRAEVLPRVWARFYQGDTSLTRPYGGMGLGLAIARHLVELHGGAVGAASRGPGLGSTFWFSLPVDRGR